MISITTGNQTHLLDFTPEGRPNLETPPQNFRSRFLEEHYLGKK